MVSLLPRSTRAGFALAIAGTLGLGGIAAAQDPTPIPTPAPVQVPAPTPPTAGFAEAPERAANPAQPNFIAPPDNYILDPGYLLDPPRRAKLESHLEAHRRETGIRIYLAAYPSPARRGSFDTRGAPPGPIGSRPVSAAYWFTEPIPAGSAWRSAGAASEILAPAALQGVLERCERNLKKTKNVAMVLREGAMDLEFELRSALHADQRKRQRTAPLRIGLIVGIGGAALIGSIFFIHQLRVQNLFGRAHRFIRRPDVQPRYGGLCSGGTSAVVRFGEQPPGS
jgi:hypothetical protein